MCCCLHLSSRFRPSAALLSPSLPSWLSPLCHLLAVQFIERRCGAKCSSNLTMAKTTCRTPGGFHRSWKRDYILEHDPDNRWIVWIADPSKITLRLLALCYSASFERRDSCSIGKSGASFPFPGEAASICTYSSWNLARPWIEQPSCKDVSTAYSFCFAADSCWSCGHSSTVAHRLLDCRQSCPFCHERNQHVPSERSSWVLPGLWTGLLLAVGVATFAFADWTFYS